MAEERLSYEQARDELTLIVRRLEEGGASLEESLALWERSEQLTTVCQRWLDGARARLTAAVAGRTDSDKQSRKGDSPHPEGVDSDRISHRE